ncbi:MAG: VanZ family protein, partial [bacterium]|nr:VanZ family protein [bacterium]
MMQRVLFLWGPVILWAVLIYYLSSISGLAVGEGAVDLWTRKPAHIGEYAVLFALVFRAIRGSFGNSWKLWEVHLGAGVLTFAYAISDEIHQGFVPTRA